MIGAAYIAEMKELLRHGANVNHQDKSGETVLLSAIWPSRRDEVEFLISNGADVNISKNSGEDSCAPLQHALSSFRIISKLTPSVTGNRGTAVEWIESYFDIIKLIVPLSDVFSYTTRWGKTEPCVVSFFRTELGKRCFGSMAQQVLGSD